MDVREKLLELIDDALQRKEGTARVVGKRYVNTIANHLIENGVTVQEWISVKEPPKERGEYLCYFKYEPESPDVICQNTYYGSGRWMSESSRVTHWAYLLHPPKGE